MSISYDTQLKMIQEVRNKRRAKSLEEKWAREEKINRKFGVYRKKDKTVDPVKVARKVSDEELKKILQNN
ncbi:hypothetical protein [Staphylococcus hominis]|uniref:hypothetical protein n=1 Tax=Staphylococcus hominis TaxID=1290 RepID=UPI0021A39984|nr:hypothetical protein [Staphylococcus hominis]MCT1507051.1 hypothetical protein [Staphylococcus hominis]